MKNNLVRSLFLSFVVSLSLNAQNDKTRANGSSLEVDASDSKAKFINNQDYLSVSSLKDYKSYFGDSLKGFDESAIKVDLISRHFYGGEYLHMMNYLKRDFINKKYKIGPEFIVQSPAQSPQNSFKPIGGGNVINIAPCVNEDFESTSPGTYNTSTAVAGWVLETANNSGQNGACVVGNYTSAAFGFNPGSPEFSIVATPVIGHPYIGTLPHSPLGGFNVAALNNLSPGVLITRLRTTFPVTSANTLFQFAYAGSWDGSGHACCDQPAFNVRLYGCGPNNSIGPQLTCSSISLTPSGQACQSGVPGYSVTNGVSWTNWVVKYIDLTPYIGTCVTFIVTNNDCDGGAHHGSAYFDARCGGQQLIGTGIGGAGGSIAGPVSFCAGSNQAIIAAPAGYQTYQWIAPGPTTISAGAGGTAPTLTVSPVVSGAVYTVQLNTPSGCSFIATNTILPSVVNIAGVGSGSTCPGGASGTGTVVGNGSGTGYNYTWLNSNSVTVGTASTVTGLAPGVYSVVLTGLGAAGCGSAVATTTVSVAPPGVINILKPYCGAEAYLNTIGGTNYHWYNGNSLITGTAGAQANYTVTSPCNLCIYRLSYLSVQGCQDSVVFTLVQSPPGLMNASNVSLICPGGTNGTAVISMTPAAGAPPGANSFSVYALGQTPAYNSSLSPTPLTAFTATGLAAGNYSVNTFDGSCKYGTSFVVQALTYNYTVSPVTQTLCSGNSIAAGITFSVPPSLAQYNYSWTPATFLAGNTQQSTIISPTTALGTVTNIIYSIVVTPTIANCPITKTISIVVANPATPTLSAIAPLCNNSNPITIIATPGGGTFSAANANLIGSSSGILSPSFAAIGTNNYTYSYGVFTCVATNTGSFQVSQFNTAALTGSVPNLCVTNSAFNLMNIVQSSTTGVWSAPSAAGAISPNSNVFNPSGLNTNTYTAYYNTFSTPNPSACPDVSSLLISVTKTITPYISPVPQFCNNQGAINMTVSPSGGTWSGNGVSSAGVITPSVLGSGNPSVSYTVNIGPCVNTNSTTLTISQFNTAALTGSIAHLCVTNNPINLLSIMQSTVNATWSGTNAQNNLLNPAGLPTNIYNYTVSTTSSPNPTLCPDSRTIAVSVLNPPAPTITQVGPFCNNAGPIQLVVTPNSGAWTPSPYLSNTGVFTPSLSPVGNNIVQYVIGTSTCNSQQTKQISIEAFVSAAITNPIPDQCNTGSPVNLLPVTQNNLGVWSGSGISGTSFNPGLSGAGNFVLTYNTLSSPSGLCPDQSTVAVHVYSLALPSVAKIGPFCNSNPPKQLIVQPTGGFFGGANTNAVTTQGLFNPGAAIVGDNIINYSITAGPCVAYAQTTVTIEKFVSADLEKYAGPFCKTNAPVNLNSYVQNPSGTWSGPGVIGTMFNPSLANIGDNNFVIYQTHSMPTATLCPDTSALRIRVNNIPSVTILSNIYKGCVPLEITFNTPSANSGKGIWDFGDGSETKKGLTISYTYTTPGVYPVLFTYTDEEGVCSTQAALSTSISVFDLPKAGFSAPEEVLISNPEIQLTNISTVLGDNTYTWKIGSLYQVSEVNPSVLFPKIGRYQITLTATTPNGCKDEFTKTIEVKNDFNIYIPSSFSPNFDKLNDEFKPVFSPYGLDSKSYEMEIFDRWGHSLFHTTDVNKGWDGSLQNKGEPLKEEVYVYRIKYKDMDGNVYNKMGHLSLLK